MSKEAMKLALEALISYGKSPYIKQSHPKRWANGNEAIKALEEALANHCEDNLDMVKQEQKNT
jgi:predicted RNase H-like HicB family nuclease